MNSYSYEELMLEKIFYYDLLSRDIQKCLARKITHILMYNHLKIFLTIQGVGLDRNHHFTTFYIAILEFLTSF